MAEKKLIFDIGMHNGQDTKYYLKKGYKVVAVEANPLLARENSQKFSKAVADGDLIILNIGIADKEDTLPFYINKRLSVWSSFDREAGTRNNSPYEVVEVKCTTTAKLFEEYGIPYYLKVDIEGFDHYCISDIPPATEERPQYVSCEATDVGLIHTLYDRGYRKFKLIHQVNDFKPINLKQEAAAWFPKYLFLYAGFKKRIHKIFPLKFEHGASGPFGEDTSGEWQDYETTVQTYRAFYQFEKQQPLNGISWFDVHASL